MKLKSYLRGLGIGIIVTALLLHFSNGNTNNVSESTQPEAIETVLNIEARESEASSASNETVNDDLLDSIIIEEAEKQEEATSLENENIQETLEAQDAVQSKEEEETTINPEEESETIETTSEQEQMLDLINQVKAEENDSLGNTISNEASESVIEIAIVKGDDSGTVSRKLYNVGLIDNPSEFDAYLMQHGYDKKISVGSVKIEPGSSWMQIAEKLSGH